MNPLAEQASSATRDGERLAPHQKLTGRSHLATRERFDSATVAARYPSSKSRSRRDEREWRCISRLFEDVPLGARVLDLPSGTGRMTGRLIEAGYAVTAADSSSHMLQQVRSSFTHQLHTGQPALHLSCCDVLQTPFANGAFDAVLCNRLFHHFVEAETRQAALAELARICQGPIVLSFFRNFGIDAIRFHLKHAVRGTVPHDRIPISMRNLQHDISLVGLKVVDMLPTRWGISPQWYVKLVRRS